MKPPPAAGPYTLTPGATISGLTLPSDVYPLPESTAIPPVI